jgi:hypothetical protein
VKMLFKNFSMVANVGRYDARSIEMKQECSPINTTDSSCLNSPFMVAVLHYAIQKSLR